MAHPRNSHRFIASFLIAAFLVLSLIATSVMRPYAYAYIAIVFGSAVAFFAYAWAAWYFQFDLNWPIAVAFFSLWLIKNEAWAMILPSATGDTDDRRKPGFNPD